MVNRTNKATVLKPYRITYRDGSWWLIEQFRFLVSKYELREVRLELLAFPKCSDAMHYIEHVAMKKARYT